MKELLQFPREKMRDEEYAVYMKEMIRAWLCSKEVRRLLSLFGFSCDASEEEYMHAAAAFAKAHMDFRSRRERFMIRDDDFAKEHRILIEEIIHDMCMDGDEAHLEKDMADIMNLSDPALLIMGGGAKANEGRAQLASEIYRRRKMPVSALSAERVMETGEEATEFDHLTACVKEAFHFAEGIVTPEIGSVSALPEEERRTLSRTCVFSDDVMSLSCPSSEPAVRRANTPDTIAYLLARYPAFRNRTLVLVSSYRYRPYHVFMLSARFPKEQRFFFTGKIQKISEKENVLAYVQEVQAGIVSAVSLYDVIR